MKAQSSRITYYGGGPSLLAAPTPPAQATPGDGRMADNGAGGDKAADVAEKGVVAGFQPWALLGRSRVPPDAMQRIDK
ncbi:MAG: hypothetical protein LQ342_008110, partial [Letrouitia transgressa]